MANDLEQRAANRVATRNGGKGQSPEMMLKSMEAEFVRALPKTGPDATQLIRDSTTLLRQTPKLQQCEPLSFIGAVMTCAQLGLRPGIGALGEAWVLPMWNGKEKRMDATFIMGYPGMLALANRSGEIDHIASNVVREKDFFDADYATGQITHPVQFGPRGNIIGFYAVFSRKGSDKPAAAEFKSLEEMEKHRDKFAMAKKDGNVFGPWAQHFEAMGRKTMLRQLFNRMPRTTEIQNALIADNTVRHDLAPDADLAQVTEQPAQIEHVEDTQQPQGDMPSPVGEGAPMGDPDDPWGEKG